jgi:hypothetical protein
VAGLLGVEQAEDGSLAVDGGHGGHPHVDGAAAGADPGAAVLGEAPLGDVEVGHDLDAADDPGPQGGGRPHGVVEHAVDAQAHPQPLLVGLDVDVRGPAGDGPPDDGLDEADDGRLGHRVLDQLLGAGEVVGLLGGGLQGLGHLGLRAGSPVEGGVELGGVDEGDDDLAPEQRAQVVEGEHVRRVGHGHHDPLVLVGDGEGPVPAGHGQRDRLGHRPVHREVLEVDEADPGLAGQGAQQVHGADQALVQEDLPEPLAHLLLEGQSRFEVRVGDLGRLEQDVAESFTGRHEWSRRRRWRRREPERD